MVAYLALPRIPPRLLSIHEGDRGGRLSAAQAVTAARLEAVALELFEDQGFEATTIDELAQRAGVNRRTFFRYFPSKEDVVFSHHVDHLDLVDDVLAQADQDPPRAAARALQAVVDAYADDVETVRRRTRLVRKTPALRDREVLWLDEYQHRIGDHLARQEHRTRDALFARVIAAALIAAFRQILTDWADHDFEHDPRPMFASLADELVERLTASGAASTRVSVASTELSPEQTADLIDEEAP